MFSRSLFVSRGDDSGTHKKELSIWEQIGKKRGGEGYPVRTRGMEGFRKHGRSNEKWYIESGAGMAETLRIANEKNAYCLTDRSTWIVYRNQLPGLKLLVERDEKFLNYYSIIPVSPAKFPWVNYSLSMKLVKFLTGKDGQKIISEFGKTKYGQPLFYVNP